LINLVVFVLAFHVLELDQLNLIPDLRRHVRVPVEICDWVDGRDGVLRLIDIGGAENAALELPIKTGLTPGGYKLRLVRAVNLVQRK
jgi:hypothetical protein